MFLLKALKAILVLYNLILVSVLLLVGGQAAGTGADFVLLLLLLPVLLYFFLGLIRKRSALVFILSLTTVSFLLFLNIWRAGSSADYLSVLLILPLPLYFWETLIGRLAGRDKKSAKAARPAPSPSLAWEDQSKVLAAAAAKPVMLEEPQPPEALAEEPAPVTDPHRRDFLKKVGGVGIGLLAYSLLNPKQVGAAFFGSVPGPGTVAIKDTNDVKINPAEKYPTSGYGISEIDDAGTTFYYGFINKDGAWYILKEDDTAGDLAYRYAKGVSGFSTAWTNRGTQSYDYFDNTF